MMLFELRQRCSVNRLTRVLLLVTLVFFGTTHGDEPETVEAEKTKTADQPVAEKSEPAKPRPKYKRPVLIRFEGPIYSLSQQYLYRKLLAAKKLEADLVVIELDSPGGTVQHSSEIAETLRDLKSAHTVAFVPREAISGAAMLSLGCDEIVISRLGRFGDVGVIYGDENGQFHYAPEKERSYVARTMRDLATAKGRPPALAEAMVDKDLVIYRFQDKQTGTVSYLPERDVAADEKADRWEKGPVVQETNRGNFLTVNGERAVELQLANGLAENREELRAHLGIDHEWTVMEQTTTDTAVMILNHPFITFLLIVVGLIALFVEICVPGITVGGIVSALCFAMFFWSRFLGGTSGWLEVVLFVLGAGLLAVEIFVLPGFGIAGLTGLALMAVSFVMACQDFIIPHSASQAGTLTTSLAILVGAGVTFLISAVFLGRRFKSIPLLNRLVLAGPGGSPPGGQSPVMSSSRAVTEKSTANANTDSSITADCPVRVGDEGIAESALRPAGRAKFGANFVDVVTDGSFIAKGTRVRVIQANGRRVVVGEA